jgi:hypothetical protein
MTLDEVIRYMVFSVCIMCLFAYYLPTAASGLIILIPLYAAMVEFMLFATDSIILAVLWPITIPLGTFGPIGLKND